MKKIKGTIKRNKNENDLSRRDTREREGTREREVYIVYQLRLTGFFKNDLKESILRCIPYIHIHTYTACGSGTVSFSFSYGHLLWNAVGLPKPGESTDERILF